MDGSRGEFGKSLTVKNHFTHFKNIFRGVGGAQMDLIKYDQVGVCGSAVMLPNSASVYYQHIDGGIHVVSGAGTTYILADPSTVYTDKLLVPAAGVRANTPIAVIPPTTALNAVSSLYLH